MNPADKFVAPRAAPPTPRLARLNTSPLTSDKRRSSRSESPRSGKSPWSPRSFFSFRSTPTSALPQGDGDRGREHFEHATATTPGDAGISHPTLLSRTDEGRECVPLSVARGLSPPRRATSREPSPLRQPNFPDTSPVRSGLLSDETIEEEDDYEDDSNFATLLASNPSFTSLSPPPPHGNATLPPISKPLPALPVERFDIVSQLSPPIPLPPASLFPAPLCLSASINRVEVPADINLPRSHFSVDSLASALSQIDDTQSSHTFSTASSPSVPDEEVFSSGDVINRHAYTTDAYSPTASPTVLCGTSAFQGYELPADECDDHFTFRKTIAGVPGDERPLGLGLELGVGGLNRGLKAGDRTTFGVSDKECAGTHGPMREFISEMGYLGGVIVGK